MDEEVMNEVLDAVVDEGTSAEVEDETVVVMRTQLSHWPVN